LFCCCRFVLTFEHLSILPPQVACFDKILFFFFSLSLSLPLLSRSDASAASPPNVPTFPCCPIPQCPDMCFSSKQTCHLAKSSPPPACSAFCSPYFLRWEPISSTGRTSRSSSAMLLPNSHQLDALARSSTRVTLHGVFAQHTHVVSPLFQGQAVGVLLLGNASHQASTTHSAT